MNWFFWSLLISAIYICFVYIFIHYLDVWQSVFLVFLDWLYCQPLLSDVWQMSISVWHDVWHSLLVVALVILLTMTVWDILFEWFVLLGWLYCQPWSDLSLAPVYWYVAACEIWGIPNVDHKRVIYVASNENGNCETMKMLLNWFACYDQSEWPKRS